jgi:hypothetical protein
MTTRHPDKQLQALLRRAAKIMLDDDGDEEGGPVSAHTAERCSYQVLMAIMQALAALG